MGPVLVRNLRGLLFIVLVITALFAVVVPFVYFYTASQLPTLDSEFDLERAMSAQVTSERMALGMGEVAQRYGPVKYQRPDFARLPTDLVNLYIAQRGCPTYFQTPREEGLAWARRVIGGLIGSEPPGDGWCERLFALRLAERLGVKGNLRLAVAAHKIHSFLQKDQLIAYDLSTIWFDEAVVGVEPLAMRLFEKKLEKLELNELVELMLVLPPNNYYGQIRDCVNPVLIQQSRDTLLQQLRDLGFIPEDKLVSARTKPVACDRYHHH